MKATKTQGIIKFNTLPEYYGFFNKVPAEKWCTLHYVTDDGQMCALGLLGGRNHQNHNPGHFRNKLKIEGEDAARINDGETLLSIELGDTPKERILNAIVLKESGILDDVD